MTRTIRAFAQTLLPRLSSGEVLVLDDASALRRYAKVGDPRAFEVLVQRYQSMVLNTCRRVMHSSADAEDAAQETFLKLARRAGEIRSNLAAWLHACALRTSIDLLRAQATRSRAEAAVAEAAPADEAEKTWREIKPLLDEAIAALEETDRDLIVSRFLAGRPQNEMAREAGVNPGTMHRRIDAALDRLRAQLAGRGMTSGAAVAIGGGVGVGAAVGAAMTSNSALAAALGHAGASTSTSLLTPALMSIGLAEMGAGAATGAAGTKLVSVVLASVIGLGVIGSGIYLAAVGGPLMSAAPVVAGGFDKPKQATPVARLVSQSVGDKPDGSVTHAGDTIRTCFHKKDDGRTEDVVMKILSVSGDRNLNKKGIAKGTMRVRFEAWNTGRAFMREQLQGKERDATYEVEGDLLTLSVRLDVELPPPPAGQAQTESVPPEARIVVNRVQPPDPKAPAPLIPAMGGTWEFVNDCTLQIDNESVVFSWIQGDGSSFPAIKFRVLEWENAGPYSKVQTIVTANAMDQAMVGKRVKLLASREDKRWVLVWNEPKTKKLNEWPANLEAKPGEIVRFVFQESAR